MFVCKASIHNNVVRMGRSDRQTRALRARQVRQNKVDLVHKLYAEYELAVQEQEKCCYNQECDVGTDCLVARIKSSEARERMLAALRDV